MPKNTRKNHQKGGSLNDIEYLYHCTHVKYLDSILKTGKLLNTSTRNASTDTAIKTAAGEGSAGRKLGHAKISIGNPNFWSGKDAPEDADGVYFRTKASSCPSKGHIMLVFDRAILDDQSCTWHINTTENNGFYLAAPGVEAEAPYSGDMGVTYDRSNADDYGEPDPYQELVILENVNLKYLDHIRVRNPETAEKVRSLISIPIFVSTLD